MTHLSTYGTAKLPTPMQTFLRFRSRFFLKVMGAFVELHATHFASRNCVNYGA